MAKKNGSITYKCSECGEVQPKWMGRCPQCGNWNTLEEFIEDSNAKTPAGRGRTTVQKIKPVPLSTVATEESPRISTGIDEFDRVLGEGATKRSAILIGGEPGIGKSTLLLQSASNCSKNIVGRILYISGEESASQIKNRAVRLELDVTKVEILCSMRLEDILSALDSLNPTLVIVDSIQTVYSAEAGMIPGTVNQLKFCANELISWVKERERVLIMTAHITKEGVIAGPKSLEHMVDTVISFERTNNELRFLRAQKNRFGSVDELGIFTMNEKGLETAKDPSALFITQREGKIPAGVATGAVFEGSRVFLVEIQALTVPAKASISRVFSDKIDSARVNRVAAVLEKRLGLRFSDQDLYINVAGGMRISESAVDAALAAALYSARTDVALPEKSVLCGELSLAGEIMPVGKLKQRIKAAKNLGYETIFTPVQEDKSIAVKNVKELISKIFG